MDTSPRMDLRRILRHKSAGAEYPLYPFSHLPCVHPHPRRCTSCPRDLLGLPASSTYSVTVPPMPTIQLSSLCPLSTRSCSPPPIPTYNRIIAALVLRLLARSFRHSWTGVRVSHCQMYPMQDLLGQTPHINIKGNSY